MTATGDKEIVLASEETQRRNLQSVVQHVNETRKGLGELGSIVDALQNQVLNQAALMEQLKLQLSTLQQQMYRSGTANLPQ